MKIKTCLKIFHTNHKITKTPDGLRRKTSSLYYHTLRLEQFLQKTKSNTVQISAGKGKSQRCKIVSWAIGFLNNVLRVILLVRMGFPLVLNLMFYFNWYFTGKKGMGKLTFIVNRVIILSSRNFFTSHPDPLFVLMLRSSSSTIQDDCPPCKRSWEGHQLWRNINL